MADSSSSSSVNVGCGCLPVIIGAIILWGLIFGVNYGGKHHEISCSGSGVTIQ